LPIFDIIHNAEFIERITGQDLTPKNAEDNTCSAVRKTLDLVRHFTIPKTLETRIYTDEDGFKYKDSWWTKEIIYRPIKNLGDARKLMEKDVERIYNCINAQKFCHQAKEQVNLFGENFDYPEEVNDMFERITKKLDDVMMIAPETVPGLYTATHRFGFDWFTYIYYDFPDLALKYYDALIDYELFRIDSFAPTKLSKIAFISEATAFNSGLLWPPEFMKNIIYPRVEKCIKQWKKYGYYVIFHSDGNKWSIISDILKMGADSINPFEPLATMEIGKFRQLYPEAVCGSMIDCQDLLAFGTAGQIRDVTIKAIEDSGGRKTLIGSTSEIHPEIPVDNALAMYNIARDYIL